MIQGVKSVLIGQTKEFGVDEVSSALGYGLSLAQQAEAHATIQAASVKLVLSNTWVSGFGAGLLDAENRRLRGLAEAAVRSAQTDAAAAGVACTTYAPQLGYNDLLASFTDLARVHDLTILDAEPEIINVDRGLLETLLTGSGRPLVVVPPNTTEFSCRRVILAWDGSARAARAANDALPFLRAAQAVEVVSVAGEKDLPDTVTGADITQHLARHGISATAHQVEARNGDVAETIRDSAKLFQADMIAMGGYVHSRLREMIFGGVTQSLLKQCPVPLFMSY